MSTVKNIKILRTISWDGSSSQTTISINEYLSEMKQYGLKKAKTTRSSRKYLRSLGLNIDKKGIITK